MHVVCCMKFKLRVLTKNNFLKNVPVSLSKTRLYVSLFLTYVHSPQIFLIETSILLKYTNIYTTYKISHFV